MSRCILPVYCLQTPLEAVDLTDAVVRLFKPSAQALKWIEDLKQSAPLSIERLEGAHP